MIKTIISFSIFQKIFLTTGILYFAQIIKSLVNVTNVFFFYISQLYKHSWMFGNSNCKNSINGHVAKHGSKFSFP